MSVIIRPATEADLHAGLLDVLSQLSPNTGAPPRETEQVFRWLLDSPDYRVWVAVEGGEVVGSVRVLFERKLTRDCGVVAHVEDVVVTTAVRGSGVGALLVKAAVREANDRGCYKVILDCTEANVAFYEKCGFHRHEVGMRMDLPARAPHPA